MATGLVDTSVSMLVIRCLVPGILPPTMLPMIMGDFARSPMESLMIAALLLDLSRHSRDLECLIIIYITIVSGFMANMARTVEQYTVTLMYLMKLLMIRLPLIMMVLIEIMNDGLGGEMPLLMFAAPLMDPSYLDRDLKRMLLVLRSSSRDRLTYEPAHRKGDHVIIIYITIAFDHMRT